MEKYVDLVKARLSLLPRNIQFTEMEYKGHTIASKCSPTAEKHKKVAMLKPPKAIIPTINF